MMQLLSPQTAAVETCPRAQASGEQGLPVVICGLLLVASLAADKLHNKRCHHKEKLTHNSFSPCSLQLEKACGQQ